MLVASAAPAIASWSDDQAALCRARIAAAERERAQLLDEQKQLQQFLDGFGEIAADFPACSTAVSHGNVAQQAADSVLAEEQFVLLHAERMSAPVADVSTNAQGIVAAATWDGNVPLFDLSRCREVGRLEVGSEVGSELGSARAATAAAFTSGTSPALLCLAVGSDVQLWRYDCEAAARQLVETLPHLAPITTLDSHASQSLLASAADDGQALLWSVDEQRRVLRALRGSSSELSACRFLGGSDFFQFGVATAGMDGTSRVWDMRRPVELRQLQGPTSSAATAVDAAPEDFLLCTGYGNGEIVLWDMRTWRELRRLDLKPHIAGSGSPAYCRSLAVARRGAFLAAGGLGGELLIFDLKRRCTVHKALHHQDSIASLVWGGEVSWADASDTLICGSLDGSFTCWAHGGRSFLEDC